MFFAHSGNSIDRSDWQALRDHLVAVGALASERGVKFGAQKAAGLAGLLHDLGKYSLAFQRRLSGSGEPVDHSTAGAQEVIRLVTGGMDRGMAELVAYAIAGHHAGLPDREGDAASLTERLGKTVESLDPIWRDQIRVDGAGLFPTSFRHHADRTLLPFQLGFLGRMLFSCLVDADFRDTEAFYAGMQGGSIDRGWPTLPDIVERLIAAFDTYVAEKRKTAPDTDVNLLRAEILAHVRTRASYPTGTFALTVPTGGGKTLTSLAFALEHAKHHGLERIITAIPFTSVIDQTAAIFREVLGNDIVLEHHSAIDEEHFRAREGADKLRLAMEDWAAPIVVTTNVQLFESLFASRPSRCRKLHNLARSVIVLDEAQTIPLPVLRPCVAVLDELTRNYNTSIVLCTATQPALAAPKFVGGFTLGPERELAPDPQKLFVALKRTKIRRIGELTDDDLLADIGRFSHALVIVNSRAHALTLYRKANEAGLDGVVHLTTRQYPVHRREILASVRERLKEGRACRLIATSLVEAGVDLDFARVWHLRLDQRPKARQHPLLLRRVELHGRMEIADRAANALSDELNGRLQIDLTAQDLGTENGPPCLGQVLVIDEAAGGQGAIAAVAFVRGNCNHVSGFPFWPVWERFACQRGPSRRRERPRRGGFRVGSHEIRSSIPQTRFRSRAIWSASTSRLIQSDFRV
jgi:CRISPR-associated endonuclease/helicase Cas3